MSALFIGVIYVGLKNVSLKYVVVPQISLSFYAWPALEMQNNCAETSSKNESLILKGV